MEAAETKKMHNPHSSNKNGEGIPVTGGGAS
jgi:hypothetical protein